MKQRTAQISRHTLETKIDLSLNLDGAGIAKLQTGVPFLEHMLEQITKHGQIDLNLNCVGDIHIDDHHSVEDMGISLGLALKQAIGDKSGINRYGFAYVPLDEALSRVVIDLSGRAGLFFNAVFSRSLIGSFDVDLCQEFFQGLVNAAQITLHIDNLRGTNAHHQMETIFKAFGRALRTAIAFDAQIIGQMPSTKGVL